MREAEILRPAFTSPSSRRAWIEIHSPARLYSPPSVALLAEGVDRNTSVHPKRWMSIVALLAEGVDRNLCLRVSMRLGSAVALLAEGVDRNTTPSGKSVDAKSRPPRGGRG